MMIVISRLPRRNVCATKSGTKLMLFGSAGWEVWAIKGKSRAEPVPLQESGHGDLKAFYWAYWREEKIRERLFDTRGLVKSAVTW